MTVPDYQSLMSPVLEIVARQGPMSMRELRGLVAKELDLSDDDLAQTVASGVGLINSRVQWAVTYLVKAGALVRPKRAHVEVTGRGRALLNRGEPVRNSDLEQFEEFRDFIDHSHRPPVVNAHGTSSSIKGLDSEESPHDLITRAEETARHALADELLTKLRSIDPVQFERLVLRLLRAMGYGTSGSMEHAGKSGDAGIDGIISQDPLGLDRIYLQAKRYAADNVVQRPLIQGFVGALMGAQGDRGVFITTSSFSSGAEHEAERVNARIELIDGHRLAELMIEYGVGVQPETTAVLFRLDEDFFEAL